MIWSSRTRTAHLNGVLLDDVAESVVFQASNEEYALLREEAVVVVSAVHGNDGT